MRNERVFCCHRNRVNRIPLMTFSRAFVLPLTDKPICRPDQKKIYGVARNEAAEILCQVDAYPAPESFKWSFNNTAETIDMPQSGYRVHTEQASTLTYTPVKVSDLLFELFGFLISVLTQKPVVNTVSTIHFFTPVSNQSNASIW